ncbi:hypothetical protein M6B38_402065 [Iris pallida]|uniref:Uncharacterized protein n=1 Tax=Iris pallida TaxID=29817 RepID=A0AAX6FTX1_IRIPA|nr:hypothetical protein M6B38_402065 [Iris pallida]
MFRLFSLTPRYCFRVHSTFHS